MTLRPAGQDDEEFLYRVYASTREEVLAILPWTGAQREAFLRMQFRAQDTYYRSQYPNAEYSIITRGETPAGRIYVNRSEDEIRLIDIALLPAHRNAGIGTTLLRSLLSEAKAAGKPVRIHVEHFNPARRLYERLGFVKIADRGIYQLMEWRLS